MHKMVCPSTCFEP